MRYAECEVVVFRHIKSGCTFKIEIKNIVDEKNEVYDCKVIESNGVFLPDEEQCFRLSSEHVEILERITPQMTTMKYEVAKYANCIDEALRTKDKKWFEESVRKHSLAEETYKRMKGKIAN